MQPSSAHTTGSEGVAKTKKWLKAATAAAIAVVIFAFGVGVGSGAIQFSGHVNRSHQNLPANLTYTEVEQLYDMLKASYDGKLDESKLQDGLKKGLVEAAGDPYTVYFNVKEATAFDQELSGSFTGIGAQLGENEQGNIIIVSPIEGFPASKAGLRPQDTIVTINGATTSDMRVDDAVNKIRGPKGTEVKLGILRGKSEELRFTIKRDDIKLPSVTWRMLDDDIGFIEANHFADDTTNLMRQAAAEIKQKGAKRVILDLRGNPGGHLSSAVDMASLWLPKGETILQEKRGGVVTQVFKSENDQPPLQNIPTVVLLNGGSASASEIVAGALRDNQAATVIGEKSYGKGSVQEIQSIPGGSKLKVTAARWSRPNGQNIDKKGIAPDQVVKMTEADYKQNKDPQKDAAVEFLRRR